MKAIRWILGRIILFVDFLTRPKPINRCDESQQLADAKSSSLALYQFHACPFCVKVRRAIRRQALNIELRDAKNDERFRSELLEQGGKVKVPCLRIEEDGGQVKWLYESDAIVNYLESSFAAATAK